MKGSGTAGRSFYPSFLPEFSLDMFTVINLWQPSCPPGIARGRLFEDVFYRYCEYRRLNLCERSGSRTLNGHRSASGLMHENDAVIATFSANVHIELKYLTSPLDKNELLVFNQKGIDFLIGESGAARTKPLFRVILSGGNLARPSRLFAAMWGIDVVEPGRLPLLPLLCMAKKNVQEGSVAHEIQKTVPRLIMPLQERLQEFSQSFDGQGLMLSRHRIERLIDEWQVDYSSQSISRPKIPAAQGWLEQRYETLHKALRLGRLPIMVKAG